MKPPAQGAPEGTQRLLLVLHSACPRTDEQVERFALRGNFTRQAAAVATQVRQRATFIEDLDWGRIPTYLCYGL